MVAHIHMLNYRPSTFSMKNWTRSVCVCVVLCYMRVQRCKTMLSYEMFICMNTNRTFVHANNIKHTYTCVVSAARFRNYLKQSVCFVVSFHHVELSQPNQFPERVAIQQ